MIRMPIVTGLVLIGTALRAEGDLGGLIGPTAFWSLLALGCGAVLLGGRAHSANMSAPAAGGARVAAVALAAVWCLAGGDRIGVAVAMSAVWLVSSRVDEKRRIPAALLTLALVLALFTARATDILALARVNTGLLASGFATILDALGADASASDDVVVMRGLISDLGFRVTPQSLGLSVHSLVALIMFSLAWTGGRLTAWWRPLAYLATALSLRFALVAGTGIALESTREYEDSHFPMEALLDWRFGLVIDTIVACTAAMLTRGRLPSWSAPAPTPTWAPSLRFASLMILAAAAGILTSSDRVLDTTGSVKQGRIAIDEGHSLWEATDLELGRENYGTESGYNFRAMVDWLETGYGPVRRLYDPVTRLSLRDIDVLVVKTPTSHFTRSETEAIHEWVDGGGGLILIGDHTNVFGTGAVLNALAKPFGFHFDYDCLFDHTHRFEQVFHVPPILARHPVLSALDSLRFEVGCSIDIDSPTVRPLVVGRGLKSQTIDYRVSNFYPKPKDSSDLRCGSFAQVVTCTFGRGRVLAIADSTLFSTFSVCSPGRREIIEGMVGYANVTDAGQIPRLVLRVAALTCWCMLLLLLRSRDLPLAAAALVVALGAARLTTAAAESLLHDGHPRPAEGKSSREVLFHSSSSVDWAVDRFVQDHDRTHDLFFQYVTRTGQFPRLVDDFDRCLESDAPLVLIDPDPRSAAELESLLASVKKGRNVILIESSPNETVSWLAAKARLDLAPPRQDAASRRLITPSGPVDFSWPAEHNGRSISGGRPFLVEVANGPSGTSEAVVGAVERVGDGHLAIVTCGGRFANSDYGYSYSMVPDQGHRRLYELQYDLLAAAANPERDQ